MSAGTTAVDGETYAALTIAAKDAIDDVLAAKATLEDRARKVEIAQSELHASIYDALQAKVPAKFVAGLLGVSSTRIYQIRDDVSRHRHPATALG